jgi:hypothetical protein
MKERIKTSYWLADWSKSIPVMLLFFAIMFLDNDLAIKWILMGGLCLSLSIQERLQINFVEQSVSKSIGLWGLERTVKVIAYKDIKEVKIEQNSRNQYELIVEKTTGEREQLSKENVRHTIQLQLSSLHGWLDRI